MPGQEPPAPVHLRLVGVGGCPANRMMRLGVDAPALRIVGVAFRALLHLADGRLQAGEQARRPRERRGILPDRDGIRPQRQDRSASRQGRDAGQQGAAAERRIAHRLHRFQGDATHHRIFHLGPGGETSASVDDRRFSPALSSSTAKAGTQRRTWAASGFRFRGDDNNEIASVGHMIHLFHSALTTAFADGVPEPTVACGGTLCPNWRRSTAICIPQCRRCRR